MHLALVIIILASSWVGWQSSKSNDNPELSNYVISWEFVVLLLDIFLVLSYFIIVRGVEIDPDRQIHPPDASTETYWTFIIFALYFLWDFVTKFLKPRFVKIEGKFYKKVFPPNWKQLKRIWPTLICFILSLFIFIFMKDAKTSFDVSWIDWILIWLFLTFRGWKQILNKSYQVHIEQVSTLNKEELKLNPDNYPLEVTESRYTLKRICTRWIPAIVLFGSIVFYFISR